MQKIRLIGRSSRLSLLQIDIVRQKIRDHFPSLEVEIITRSSQGDELSNVPLHTVEGSDFFTQSIFDALSAGEADIAVHSLKDMSGEHFFGDHRFAVVDRDDPRDIALFRPDVEEKIREGIPLVIGTCSPRREDMAMNFLRKALPQHAPIRIQVQPIRGNVETRLKKLDSGMYDGTILATAGLNRLLRSETDARSIWPLLQDKKKMLLPLFECVPAPCQGAVVAEADPSNTKAVEILTRINDQTGMEECQREKRLALRYGKGCLQRFGVTTIHFGDEKVTFAAGTDQQNKPFEDWHDLDKPDLRKKKIFSSTDFMGTFFDYQFFDDVFEIGEPVVYISNFKAVLSQHKPVLRAKRIWTAGTRTWMQLAAAGYWVEGSADALGLESLVDVWQMPLVGIDTNQVVIITSEQASGLWQLKGWKAISTYRLVDRNDSQIQEGIRDAEFIFWTSHRQYLQYKNLIRKDVVHACPSGETAELLKLAGIRPIVFPTIKSFLQWRKFSTPLPSAV